MELQTELELGAPSWDNSEIYKNFADPKIDLDLQWIDSELQKLQTEISSAADDLKKMDRPILRQIHQRGFQVLAQIFNIKTYASTALTVNSKNEDARALTDKITRLYTRHAVTMKPLQVFLTRVDQDWFEEFMNDESMNSSAFQLRYAREQVDFLLPVEQEVFLTNHGVPGLDAWGKLYTDIAGALQVDVGTKTCGLAEAANLLNNQNEKTREQAYRGIYQAWEKQEIPVAAILNSIQGWRIENNKARTQTKSRHYLEQTCYQSRISKGCLDSLLQVTYENRSVGQEAMRLMAQELGKEKLSPWDLMAPFPGKGESAQIPFAKAMQLICEAFASFDAQLAEFAHMMWKKGWLDCASGPYRAQGGYCTGFTIPRQPRVFLTYNGSFQTIRTLAHEIGHAYHNWVMRDLQLQEISYPMTLAETASIFAETLVRDEMMKAARTVEEKKSILWQVMTAGESFLINIPARFEFEKRFVELRQQKTVSIAETKKLMKDSWAYWYEDTLTEYNDMYWASKLHFLMSDRAFYNYPYLFGYLFSLGIYSQKESRGDQFKEMYRALLRDTGVMTADDLARKHLQIDISQKEFWQKSIDIVADSVQQYKTLMGGTDGRLFFQGAIDSDKHSF